VAMTYRSDNRRWRVAVRHASALLLFCPIAMAAEEKPTEPAGRSVVEGLYRVQEIYLTLTMTKDPSIVRREIIEQISEICRAASPTGSGISLWDTDRDRMKLTDGEFIVVATFPERKVKIESMTRVDDSMSAGIWAVSRGDGSQFSQTALSIGSEPWSPGTQIMSSNLTRDKRLGPCPVGWAVGEHRWLAQRKLKQMPPPEFPDGPIDKLKR